MTIHLENKPFTPSPAMMIDTCMDQIDRLNKSLTNENRDVLDELVTSILDTMQEAKESAQSLAIDLENAEIRFTRGELMGMLHSEKNHTGWVVTCDQCAEDARLFIEWMG